MRFKLVIVQLAMTERKEYGIKGKMKASKKEKLLKNKKVK